MAKTISKITKLLIIGLIIRIILVLISNWHPDLPNHIDWGLRFLSYGSRDFYESSIWGVSWANQPFGTILLFALIAVLKNAIFGFIMFLNNSISFFPSFIIPIIESNLHAWLVKLPFILADIGLAYFVYKIVLEYKPACPTGGPKMATLAASLFLFNPVLIYNSAIWGQTDSLINLLAISGIYLVFKKKYFYGVFLFLFTFIFKLSLIIYVPIFGLLFLKRIKDWKKFILPTIVFIAFIFLLAIPFTFGDKTPFQWVWYMYTNRVLPRQGSMLNGNAFNFWFLLFSIDFSKSEFLRFANITYQLWGRIFLVLFLIPVWVKFLKSKLTLSNIFQAMLLSAFGSFIFLTNMHERYLYPIFPLFIALIFIKRQNFTIKKLVWISLIHLINLYNLWFYPMIKPLKSALIFSNFAICRVLSFILIIICFDYFIKYLKSETQ